MCYVAQCFRRVLNGCDGFLVMGCFGVQGNVACEVNGVAGCDCECDVSACVSGNASVKDKEYCMC